ncbi:MAG: hypothetical protein ACRCWR_09725 [Saezia sp.]
MKKLKLFACTLALSTITSVSSVAYASSASDALGRCLVEKTSQQDRIELVQWIFGALSVHPALKELGNVSTETLDTTDKKVANLLTRLLVSDCNAQLKVAVAADGQAVAIQSGFQVLGQVAAMDLMQNPMVSQRTQAFAKYIDEKKLEAAMK